MNKPFAYEIMVDTVDSFMTMGPFFARYTISTADMCRKIRRTIIQDHLPHYSTDDILGVRVVFCDGDIAPVFECPIDKVWPSDFDCEKKHVNPTLELATELDCSGAAEIHEDSLVLYKSEKTNKSFDFFVEHEVDGFVDTIVEIFEEYNSLSDALGF